MPMDDMADNVDEVYEGSTNGLGGTSVTGYLKHVGGYCKPCVGGGAQALDMLLMSSMMDIGSMH